MKIGGLQKITLIDYPGKIACTVFLIGCNFRCPFCYSPELVLPEKIKFQPRISEKNFFAFLKHKKKYLNGVVVCGGEPTLHSDLASFLAKIKKMGFEVKLDTNGSRPKILKKLIDEKLVDYIAMDVKAPLDEEFYQKTIGKRGFVETVKKSINLIKESSIDYEFRTTVVPTIHRLSDIIKIAKQIGPAKRYYLQNFRPEKTLNPNITTIKPFSDEELKKVIEKIRNFFDDCKLR